MNTIIVSSSFLYKRICEMSVALKPDDDVNIGVKGTILTISVLDGVMEVISQNDFEFSVKVNQLQSLFKIIRLISDQPLTLQFGKWIEIKNILI